MKIFLLKITNYESNFKCIHEHLNTWALNIDYDHWLWFNLTVCNKIGQSIQCIDLCRWIFDVQCSMFNNFHAYNHDNAYNSFRLTFRYSVIAFDNMEKSTKFNSPFGIQYRGQKTSKFESTTDWTHFLLASSTLIAVICFKCISNGTFHSLVTPYWKLLLLFFIIYDAFRAYLVIWKFWLSFQTVY